MKKADLERAEKEAHAAYKVACDIAEAVDNISYGYGAPTQVDLHAIKVASDKAHEALHTWAIAKLRLLGRI